MGDVRSMSEHNTICRTLRIEDIQYPSYRPGYYDRMRGRLGALELQDPGAVSQELKPFTDTPSNDPLVGSQGLQPTRIVAARCVRFQTARSADLWRSYFRNPSNAGRSICNRPPQASKRPKTV
jgi:hypothetical protein